MEAVDIVVAVAWAAFWLYWLVAAFSMKRGRLSWRRELGIRAVLIAIVIILVRFGVFHRHAVHGAHVGPWRVVIGLILLAVGLGLAVWARLHMGRNWGMPMTRKHEPELVTTGPYRLVRHPIYSGTRSTPASCWPASGRPWR